MKIIHRFGSEAARTWSPNGQTMAERQIQNGQKNAPIPVIFTADTKQAAQLMDCRLIANPLTDNNRQKTGLAVFLYSIRML